jgi:ABC-type hemin transport system substrate-binding protein
MLAGTLGTRTSGPRVDPLTATMQGIAKREVLTVLKANSIKPPKGDEVVTFANGATKTMADMIATRLAHPEHGAKIKKEAEGHIRELDRKRAKAAKEAEALRASGPATAEGLGL